MLFQAIGNVALLLIVGGALGWAYWTRTIAEDEATFDLDRETGQARLNKGMGIFPQRSCSLRGRSVVLLRARAAFGRDRRLPRLAWTGVHRVDRDGDRWDLHPLGVPPVVRDTRRAWSRAELLRSGIECRLPRAAGDPAREPRRVFRCPLPRPSSRERVARSGPTGLHSHKYQPRRCRHANRGTLRTRRFGGFRAGLHCRTVSA